MNIDKKLFAQVMEFILWSSFSRIVRRYRRVTDVRRGFVGTLNEQIEQERLLLKRRQAIEPIIGNLKADHRMNRYHLKGQTGDAMHAVLCRQRAVTFAGCCRLSAKRASAFLWRFSRRWDWRRVSELINHRQPSNSI
jgi:hypothetical protein